MKTIAIIGGGASGLMAAVEAALTLREAAASAESNFPEPAPRNGDAHGARGRYEVALFEADDERVGRSILATGNGRCNLSNANIDVNLYRNADFVAQTFAALQGGEAGNLALERFADMGLMLREESEGRLYPMANKATSVLDALRNSAADLGVLIEVGKRATQVDAPRPHDGKPGCFNIRFADKTVGHADQVIVAVGGRAAPRIQLPAPLACSDMRPMLGPLRLDRESVRVTRQLNNIRVRCGVHLSRGDQPIATEVGELLFRDYGVSGVAVFNLSRLAEPGDTLSVDFFPAKSPEEVLELLQRRLERMRAFGAYPTCERFLQGMVLPAVAQSLCKRSGLKPQAALSDGNLEQLSKALKSFDFTVEGIGDERQCQVRRGGFPVLAFSPKTCEARDVAGLFVTGEALDVDAPCGGYNLQWAWASGMCAGRAAANNLMGRANA
jgi:predicted Rossmann fold flavoprotein